MARKPVDAPRELLILKLLPNLVSIMALCAGLTAIRYAIGGNIAMAVFLIGAAAVLLASPGAWAETRASWGGERTAAYVQGGFSTASPHMSGVAVGASLVLDLNRSFALEGSGSYVDRGAGSEAASLSVNAILHLASRDEEAVPYLVAGAGLYRASFDTRIARFAGPAPSGPMGSGRYRHIMKPSPPGWDVGELPAFPALAASVAGRLGVVAFLSPLLGSRRSVPPPMSASLNASIGLGQFSL